MFLKIDQGFFSVPFKYQVHVQQFLEMSVIEFRDAIVKLYLNDSGVGGVVGGDGHPIAEEVRGPA